MMADDLFAHVDDSVKSRFWEKVDVRGDDECWHWNGLRNHGGYGQFKVSGRGVGAHRLSLMMEIGRQMKSSEFACHHCDNPSCVNPAHLYVGNHATNTNDMRERNRFFKWKGLRSGSDNPRSKLTDSDVIRIRSLDGVIGRKRIAREFGVSKTTVIFIMQRKVWSHV